MVRVVILLFGAQLKLAVETLLQDFVPRVLKLVGGEDLCVCVNVRERLLELPDSTVLACIPVKLSILPWYAIDTPGSVSIVSLACSAIGTICFAGFILEFPDTT